MTSDSDLGAAMRGPRPSRGPRALYAVAAAVFLALIAIVDLLTFQIPRILHGDAPSVAKYVEHRTGLRPGALFAGAPALPDRDLTLWPLDADERARLAQDLHIALPRPAGWTVRDYRAADMWALRPDMDHCTALSHEDLRMRSLIGSARGCPPGLRGEGVRVYERDGRRIAVLVRYIPGDAGQSTPELLKSAKLTDFAAANFGQPGQMASAASDRQIAGFDYVRLPMREPDRRGRLQPRPLRLYGRQTDHGLVDVFVVSDAPAPEVQAVIGGINHAFLGAMIAPLP